MTKGKNDHKRKDRGSSGAEESFYLERKEEKKIEMAGKDIKDKIEPTDIEMLVKKIDSARLETEQQIRNSKDETIRVIKEDLKTINSSLHELKVDNEALKKENEILKNRLEKAVSDIEDLKGVTKLQSTAIADIQNYSRKDSVKIYNLFEDKRGGGETGEQTARVVCDFFERELGVRVHRTDISIAHRLQARDDRPHRAIQVKFTRRQTKLDILRNRKKLRGTPVVIVEDMCSSYMRIFNEMRDLVGKGNAWTWEGKIFVNIGGATKRVTMENKHEIEAEVKEREIDPRARPLRRDQRDRGGRARGRGRSAAPERQARTERGEAGRQRSTDGARATSPPSQGQPDTSTPMGAVGGAPERERSRSRESHEDFSRGPDFSRYYDRYDRKDEGGQQANDEREGRGERWMGWRERSPVYGGPWRGKGRGGGWGGRGGFRFGNGRQSYYY